MSAVTIRVAGPLDLIAAHAVIERAYRGDSARGGWTHEADLLHDDRTDLATLSAIIADPGQRLLVAERDGAVIGTVALADRGGGLAYLGMFCVDPALQAAGLGRSMLAEAERVARAALGADRIEMTVIDVRAELIAWYERRGYIRQDEVRPFPVPRDPPLTMVVLVKVL